MSGFVKTMIGDFNNVAVVSAILGATAAAQLAAGPKAAWLTMPLLTTVGVAWLVRK